MTATRYKLAIFLGGTGSTDDLKEELENSFRDSFQHHVIRIYIKGSQHKNVGDGFFSPNLKIAVDNFEGVFTKENVIDLDKLQQNFGDGIAGIVGNEENLTIHVDSIFIFGRSRGGVTAFLLAQKLQQRDNSCNIPVYIMADQPVPGDRISNPSCNLKEALDCTKCNNIQQVYVLLGSYQPTHFIHDTWYSQMIPSFSEDSDAMVLELPIHNHFHGDDIIFYCLESFLQKLKIISSDSTTVYRNVKHEYQEPRISYCYALPDENLPRFGKSIEVYGDSIYYDHCFDRLTELGIFTECDTYQKKLFDLRSQNLRWFHFLCSILHYLQPICEIEFGKCTGGSMTDPNEIAKYLFIVINSLIEYIKDGNVDLASKIKDATKSFSTTKLKTPNNPNFEIFRYWSVNIAFYLFTGIFGALMFHAITYSCCGAQKFSFFPFFAKPAGKAFAFNRVDAASQRVVSNGIKLKAESKSHTFPVRKEYNIFSTDSKDHKRRTDMELFPTTERMGYENH